MTRSAPGFIQCSRSNPGFSRTVLVWLLGIFLSVTVVPCTQAAASIRVAVSTFENKVEGIFGNWQLGEGMSEMLTTELFKSGQFIVLERAAMDEVISEQALSQSGLTRSETGPVTGQMLGAQFIVKGAITEFSDKASGVGGNLKYRRFGLSGKEEKAHIGLDLRLINATSGVIVASHHVSKQASSTGGQANYANADFQIGGGLFHRTPLGQATRAAMAEAVSFISRNLPVTGGKSSAAFSAFRIVKVAGDQVYINAGSNRGIEVGRMLQVYGQGEALIDPDTGLNLGSVEERSGTIRIIRIKDKYAIGITVEGGGFQRGDSLRAR